MSVQHMRPSAVAGHFYEKNPEKLQAYVKEALQAERAALSDDAPAPQTVDMVMLPHAGHVFCAHIMAQTLVRVALPQTLILLCPNHTGQGRPLSVWAQGSWQTPLGAVPVAEPVAHMLLQSQAGFTADTLAHVREHSLEVILPFLQEYVPQLSIVPIAVGTGSMDTLRVAGEALGRCIQELRQQGQDVCMVVSSDMHHFSDHLTTLALDDLALKALMTLDPVALQSVVLQKSISMCGVYASVLALYAKKVLGGHAPGVLVNHTTSFEKGGDAQRTVGYAGFYV